MMMIYPVWFIMNQMGFAHWVQASSLNKSITRVSQTFQLKHYKNCAHKIIAHPNLETYYCFSYIKIGFNIIFIFQLYNHISWNFLSLSYPYHLCGKGSIVLSHHGKPVNKPVEKNQREKGKNRKHLVLCCFMSRPAKM